MPAQVLFNQLDYVDRLTRGGFSPEQARASAEARETAFSEGVATRSDVESSKRELQSSIDALRHETMASIDALRHETIASIEALRHETIASIEASIDGVKQEISLLKQGLAEVKHDLSEVKRDVAEAESRLRLEFKRDLGDIRLEIAQSKNETLRWLFGFVIVLIGAIFTIVKYVR